jgi:hypothetical protein
MIFVRALMALALLSSCAAPPPVAYPWSVPEKEVMPLNPNYTPDYQQSGPLPLPESAGHPLPAATPAPCVEGVYSDVLRPCP